MKNLIALFVFVACVCFVPLMAFDANQYSFVDLEHDFSSIYGEGTQSTIINWVHGGDDELSNIIPLSFSFPFCGVLYNSLKISSNGFITLDTNLDMSYPNNGLTQAVGVPIIAPLWDDLDSGAPAPNQSSTYVLYQNSIANRFTVEWRNVRWNYNGASTYSQNFQVVLDAEGNIRFNYGSSGTINNPSASIGLAHNGHFISVTPDNGFSTSISNDSVDIFPTGKQYLFSPPTPTLSLLSPNGGETWHMRTTHPITWNFLNLTGNLKLELVRGADAIPVYTISSSVPVTNQLVNWIIPVTISLATDYRVKISSLSNPEITDLSDGYFGISLSTNQSLTVLSPNGGETWQMNHLGTISWSSEGVTGLIRIKLCKGNNLTEVLTIYTLYLEYYDSVHWVVPDTMEVGDDYRIKIESVDDPNIVDYSDQCFTIPALPPPSITVTEPNGGENWYMGSSQYIELSTVFITGYNKVELYKENESNPVLTIASSVSANAWHIYWTIPLDLEPGTGYKIRVSNLTNPELWDESDAPFTLSSPILTLNSPNGGENWFLNSMKTISWTYAYLPGNLRVDLVRGASQNVVHTFTNSIAVSSTTINCLIPSSVETATDYRVKISSVSAPNIYDVSDDYFSISNPILTLVSPNGGELWRYGEQVNILWNAANISGNAKIELFRTSSTNPICTISPGVEVTNNSFTWTVPSTLTPATDFRCKITLLSNTAVYDYSNAYLSIMGPPQITLSSPNGGEVWELSTIRQISWTYANISGNVSLRLFNTTNTEPVLTITNSVALSTHAINWTLPSNNLPVGEYTMEIRSLSDTSIYDVSNAPFSIALPTVNFTQPSSTTSWQADATHLITWDSNYLAGNMRLELVRGTDANLICPISNEIYAGASLVNWSIPVSVTYATDYRIRSTHLSNPNFVNYSSYFSITNNPTVTLLTPNGAESWSMGSTHQITWDASYISGTISLLLCRGNGDNVVQTISNNCNASSESFSWSVPLNLSTSNDYRVKISNNSNPDISDISDGMFSLIAPQLMLISPNGGESLIRGSQNQISWTYANVTGSLLVELYRGATMDYIATISNSVAVNSGSFTWNAPSDLALGTDYRIKISSISIPTISDISDNAFNIICSPPPLTSAADITQQPPFIYPNTPAPYEVKSKYYDPNGVNDLKNLFLRIVNPYDNSITLSYTPATNTYSVWSGASGANYASLESVSKNYTTDSVGRIGWEVTWKFKIFNPAWAACHNELRFAVMAQDASDNFSNNGVWLESNETSSFASYGITFICRDYQSNTPDDKSGWQFEIAEAIKDRLGGHAYIGRYNPLSGLFEQYDGTPDNPEHKEQILIFDWTEDGSMNFDGYAEAAADAAFAALMPYSTLRNMNNLHLIGFSRGAVVVSELTERLLRNNKPVRHVSYLDPHDWGFNGMDADFEVNAGTPDPFYPTPTDIPTGIITRAILGWQDVPYIETIFQRRGSDDPLAPNQDSCNGRAVPGTSNACFADNYAVDHPGIAEQYLNSILNSNYIFYLRPGEDASAAQGFQRSRIGNLRLGAMDGLLRTGESSLSADYSPQYTSLFNGDFSFGDAGNIPGWSFHGGCTQHCMLEMDAESGGYCAMLTQSEQSDAILRHNRFYIGRNSAYLRFKYKVVSPGYNASLCVKIEGESTLLEIPLTPTGNVFIEREINIQAYQGRVVTLSFILPSSPQTPGAIVLLDDISIRYNSVALLDDYHEDEPDPANVSGFGSMLLHGAYPNPFNPVTTIRFSLKQAQHVNLTVYNLAGRKVRNLCSAAYPVGDYNLIWDGCDDQNKAMPSGVYILKLQSPTGVINKKLTLMK